MADGFPAFRFNSPLGVVGTITWAHFPQFDIQQKVLPCTCEHTSDIHWHMTSLIRNQIRERDVDVSLSLITVTESQLCDRLDGCMRGS